MCTIHILDVSHNCLALRLLCCTMLFTKRGVKTTPTGDTNGWMITGCNLEDHVNVDVRLLDDWRVVLVHGWIVMNWLMIKMIMFGLKLMIEW